MKTKFAAAATGAVIVLLSFFGGAAAHADTTDVPVIDNAAMFTPEQVQELTDTIHAADDRDGLVYVVETIPALNGADIGSLATNKANELGVGNADTNNGVFILLALTDRKVWIALGSGVSGVVSDATTTSIVDNSMVPYFKNEDYVGGLTAGINGVGSAFTNPASAAEPSNGDPIFFYIFVGLFLFLVIGVMAVLISAPNVSSRKEKKRLKAIAAIKAADRAAAEAADELRRQQRMTESYYDNAVYAAAAVKGFKAKYEAAKDKDARARVLDSITDADFLAVKSRVPEHAGAFDASAFEKAYAEFVKLSIRTEMKVNYATVQQVLKSHYANQLDSMDSITQFKSSYRHHCEKSAEKAEANRVAQEEARKAKARAAEERADKERAARKVWDTLTLEQKRRLRNTQGESARKQLLESYNISSDYPMSVLFPIFVANYIASTYYPSYGGSSSSSSRSGSYSSGGGYSSGSSSSDSGFSSFGGGSFDGGGGGGGW